MKKQKLIRKLSLIPLITLGVTILFSAIATWDPLEKWQLKLTNHFYDQNIPSDEIVIIGIDEGSLEGGIGKWGTWSRTVYSEIIETLEQSNAKSIAIDLFFTNESDGISSQNLLEIINQDPTLEEYFKETFTYLGETHPDDEIFGETIKEYNNIYIAENFNEINYYQVEVIPIFENILGETNTSSVLYYPDSDDVVRRIPTTISTTNGEPLTALSVDIAENYLGELPSSFYESLDENNEMLINYAAPPYSFEIIPFANVYNGFLDEEDVKDKIVLIGIVTERLQDHISTPTSSDTLMPGVEMHANAIQTILDENFLTEQSTASQVATIFLLTLLLTAAVLFTGILPGVAITAALITGYQFAAEPIFDRGLILNLVYPTLALLTAYLVTTLYKFFTESKEKKQLKGAFSKYVNKDLANKILDNPEMLKLGGEKRIITVFFSDIASFTTFSEKCEPEALVAQLNEYFDVMAGIILKNGGNLNKFEGDAIMAFWGAPLDQPDHGPLAAKSALECRASLRDLHAKWQQEGKPLLNFRVGLSTGEVIAGNVGSRDRFDYTVMGDIVNLGSRLESANKQYGTHVMIPDATAAILGDQFELRRLDRLRVKGKEQPVDVYELLAHKGQLQEAHQKIIQDFHQAIEYYRNQKFDEAIARFQEVAKLAPNDGPTQTYLARCEHFKQNPPAQGWDGTWTLDHK